MREDKLESRMSLVEKKLSDAETRENVLANRKLQMDQEKQQIDELRKKLVTELEKASGFSSNEAKEMLLSRMTSDVRAESANLIRRKKKKQKRNRNEKLLKLLPQLSIDLLFLVYLRQQSIR